MDINDWNKNDIAYKTYITQEMLKKGFLASNVIFVCTKHTDKILNNYFSSLSPIFKRIKDFESNDDIFQHLEGPIAHSGFQRLN